MWCFRHIPGKVESVELVSRFSLELHYRAVCEKCGVVYEDREATTRVGFALVEKLQNEVKALQVKLIAARASKR